MSGYSEWMETLREEDTPSPSTSQQHQARSDHKEPPSRNSSTEVEYHSTGGSQSDTPEPSSSQTIEMSQEGGIDDSESPIGDINDSVDSPVPATNDPETPKRYVDSPVPSMNDPKTPERYVYSPVPTMNDPKTPERYVDSPVPTMKDPEIPERYVDSPIPDPSTLRLSYVYRPPVRRDSSFLMCRHSRPKVINIQIPDSFPAAQSLYPVMEILSPSSTPSPKSSRPSSRSSLSIPVMELPQSFGVLVCDFCEYVLRHRRGGGEPFEVPYYLTSGFMALTNEDKNRAAARRLNYLLVEIKKYSASLSRRHTPRDFIYFQEKRKCQRLLYEMMPRYFRPVVQQLLYGNPARVEVYKSVTICFCDVEEFAEIAAVSTPVVLIDFLNKLFKIIDEKINTLDAYRVESIFEAYIAVSGLPVRNGNEHAANIAELAMRVMDAAESIDLPNLNRRLRMRIGVHTGPCGVGVLDNRLPRYCIFGDTINVATILTASSRPKKIHISSVTKHLLDQLGCYDFEARDTVYLPGLGRIVTYFLYRKNEFENEKTKIPSGVKTGNNDAPKLSNLDVSNEFNDTEPGIDYEFKDYLNDYLVNLDDNEDYDDPDDNEDHDRPEGNEGHDRPEDNEDHDRPEDNEDHDRPEDNEDHDHPEDNEDLDRSDDNEDYNRPEDNENHDRPEDNKDHERPEDNEDHDRPKGTDGQDHPDDHEGRDYPDDHENNDDNNGSEKSDKDRHLGNPKLTIQGPDSPAAHSLEQSQASHPSTSSSSSFNNSSEPTVKSPGNRNFTYDEAAGVARGVFNDIVNKINEMNDENPSMFPDCWKIFAESKQATEQTTAAKEAKDEATPEPNSYPKSDAARDCEAVIRKGCVKEFIEMFNKKAKGGDNNN